MPWSPVRGDHQRWDGAEAELSPPLLPNHSVPAAETTPRKCQCAPLRAARAPHPRHSLSTPQNEQVPFSKGVFMLPSPRKSIFAAIGELRDSLKSHVCLNQWPAIILGFISRLPPWKERTPRHCQHYWITSLAIFGVFIKSSAPGISFPLLHSSAFLFF